MSLEAQQELDDIRRRMELLNRRVAVLTSRTRIQESKEEIDTNTPEPKTEAEIYTQEGNDQTGVVILEETYTQKYDNDSETIRFPRTSEAKYEDQEQRSEEEKVTTNTTTTTTITTETNVNQQNWLRNQSKVTTTNTVSAKVPRAEEKPLDNGDRDEGNETSKSQEEKETRESEAEENDVGDNTERRQGSKKEFRKRVQPKRDLVVPPESRRETLTPLKLKKVTTKKVKKVTRKTTTPKIPTHSDETQVNLDHDDEDLFVKKRKQDQPPKSDLDDSDLDGSDLDDSYLDDVNQKEDNSDLDTSEDSNLDKEEKPRDTTKKRKRGEEKTEVEEREVKKKKTQVIRKETPNAAEGTKRERPIQPPKVMTRSSRQASISQIQPRTSVEKNQLEREARTQLKVGDEVVVPWNNRGRYHASIQKIISDTEVTIKYLGGDVQKQVNVSEVLTETIPLRAPWGCSGENKPAESRYIPTQSRQKKRKTRQ